jgi:hypothetical protein
LESATGNQPRQKTRNGENTRLSIANRRHLKMRRDASGRRPWKKCQTAKHHIRQGVDRLRRRKTVRATLIDRRRRRTRSQARLERNPPTSALEIPTQKNKAESFERGHQRAGALRARGGSGTCKPALGRRQWGERVTRLWLGCVFNQPFHAVQIAAFNEHARQCFNGSASSGVRNLTQFVQLSSRLAPVGNKSVSNCVKFARAHRH